MQMLTVLDADIDIGALLDGAEDATAAIEGAGRPTLADSGSTVIQLHPSDGESTAMRADQAVAGDGPPESMDEKRHRMQDLLQRLRFVEEDQRKAFRIYGHFRFGRGWVERPTDVDKMIARLTTALEDPTSLKVKSAPRSSRSTASKSHPFAGPSGPVSFSTSRPESLQQSHLLKCFRPRASRIESSAQAAISRPIPPEYPMRRIGNFTAFFGAEDVLSNWHPSRFTYHDVEFNCVEQFMMYAKRCCSTTTKPRRRF
ncbi:hypothetical protein [Burkholderia gladioli]|uniref:hypothetical protein n=1 Tax=Burkholderia gladioli TaxID=28095 RepID=UPI002FC925B3